MSLENPIKKVLTPEEMAEMEKRRTLSDAELLKHGAEYKFDDGNKNLEVTARQKETARQEMRIDQMPATEKMTKEIRVLVTVLLEIQKNHTTKGFSGFFQKKAFRDMDMRSQERAELQALLTPLEEPYPETIEEKESLLEKLNSPEMQQKIAAHVPR